MTDASARGAYQAAVVIDARDPTYLVYRQLPHEKDGYFETLRTSGLTAAVVDVPWIEDTFAEFGINAAAWHERVAAHSDAALIVRSAGDITAAKDSGRVGIILSSQTPTIIENDLRLLRACHELGLRVLQMSYQRRNLLADGCGESSDGGVSDFGREAIGEMNRLGIAIDLSHAGARTMLETIEDSERPVFFSHSNARALVEHRRNVTDDTLRRLAERGGVCCVSAYSDFLAPNGSAIGTNLGDLARMARYVVDLIGIEHVGFGLDAGEGRTAKEMELITATIGGGSDIATRYAIRSRADLPQYADALSAEGFAAAEIDRLLGGNMQRLFTDVWGR